MALISGTRLGTYEVLGPLGAGGMGEVYRAKDLRLGREVAVKVLPAAVASSTDRLARFEREARAVAGLNHPNIVTLYSVEDEGGIRFLTMELVEGHTLSRLVAPGGLPLPRLLELAIPLADALSAAHEKGVIHRDLKPGNVMVTREGRVKVLDFGLAKLVGAEGAVAGATIAATADAPISAVGQVLGTVPYMAPEQIRGEPIDARSDLFAMGIILYELATGRRPFTGETSADVSSSILRDAPVPVQNIRSDLPRDLDRITARCLEKNPRDRFQTARDLYNELRYMWRGLPSPHELPSAVLPGAPSPASGAGAPSDAPSIAVLPFVNRSGDDENEFFSDGLSEELLNVLAKIPDLKVTGRTSSFAFKGRQEDLRQIGQKLGVSTLLEGSVRKAGNRVRITAQLIKAADGFHLWSETYDRVLDDIFAVQDDIARSVAEALHVALLGKASPSSRVSAESYELVLQGNQLVHQNTDQAVARAVSLYRAAIDRSPENAAAWAGLALAYVYKAAYGHGGGDLRASREKAREAAQRALTLDPRLAQAHEVMGYILASLDYRWKDGLDSIGRARELAPGAAGPMTAASMYLGAFGRLDEALDLARRAAEIDPLSQFVQSNLARAYSWAGDLVAASEAYGRVMELSPDMAGVHSSLGLLYLERGMGSEAIAEIQKEPSSGYRECALAIAYHAMGRKEESDAAMERLHRVGDQWGVQFAMAHARRGERDEAFRWLHRSYELHDTGIAMVKVSRSLRNLHADPRWNAFLDKIGLGA